MRSFACLLFIKVLIREIRDADYQCSEKENKNAMVEILSVNHVRYREMQLFTGPVARH